MTRKEKPKRKSLAKVKAELWAIFSLYVRMRDCIKTTGSLEWALCVSCHRRYHIKVMQAGHFVAGRRSGNLFSERGVNCQCAHCNLHLKGNTLEYRRQIIKMYGKGADLELEAEARVIKKFTVEELEALKEVYKIKISELKRKNKILTNNNP